MSLLAFQAAFLHRFLCCLFCPAVKRPFWAAVLVMCCWGAACAQSFKDRSNGEPTSQDLSSIRIPYAKLKSVVEFPSDPGSGGWILISSGVFVPDAAKKGLRKIDPKTNVASNVIDGTVQACAGAIEAFNSLWIPDCADGTIARIDPGAWKLQARVLTGVAKASPALAASSDSIWALTDEKTTLTRIDPATNQEVAELRLPAGCRTVKFIAGALWVTCPNEDLVLRIDPVRVIVDERIKVSGEPWAMDFAEGSIWVLCRRAGEVDRINPKTGEIGKTINLSILDAAGSITVADDSVWVSSPGFPITRIDLQTEKVAQQFVGDGGGAIQMGFNSIWLMNSAQKTVSRIDPRRVLATQAE